MLQLHLIEVWLNPASDAFSRNRSQFESVFSIYFLLHKNQGLPINAGYVSNR